MYAYRRCWKLAIKSAADRGIQGREVCGGGGIRLSNVAIRRNVYNVVLAIEANDKRNEVTVTARQVE